MGNVKYCRSCWEVKYLSEFQILADEIYDDFCFRCSGYKSAQQQAEEKSYLKLKAEKEKREQNIKNGIFFYDDAPLIKRRPKRIKEENVYEFVEFKKCLKCEYLLPRSKFLSHTLTKDGLNEKCTMCCRGLKRKLPVNIFPEAKPGHKFCSTCKIEKPLTEFHPKKTLKLKDGHLNQCKKCVKDQRNKKNDLQKI